MQRERVADGIYVFISDQYVQVTATVVATDEGAVLFDTLLYPDETRAIKRFVENRLGTRVKYVINSHFHADHTAGTCAFEGAQVVAHARCRELLEGRGRKSLEYAKANIPELYGIEVVLPQLIFDDGVFQFGCGGKTFQLWATPGHSLDSIVCLIKEDRILLGADTMMPLPYFVDGSFDAFLASLEGLRNGSYENVVQGHGDIILRGEVEDKIRSDIGYLNALRREVDRALASASPEKALEAIDIESCGKSRILLHGAAVQLHRQNVLSLANQRRALLPDH